MKLIFHSIRDLTIPAALIANKINKIIKLPDNFEVNVVESTKSEIRKLNKGYRQKDEPTDVLSFQSPVKNQPGGDIYICSEIIKSNAGRFSVSYEEEKVRTLIHGILHLIGMNHKYKMGERDEKLFDLQERIVRTIFNE
jgi:probable rRNA maturation factor